MRRLLLIILCATPLSAQVVELKGGTSTLSNASGGDAVVYLRTTETEVGGGLLGDRRVFSFAERFTYHKWDTTLGDAFLCTTAGQASVAVAVRGLTFERGGLTLFGGLTGSQLGSSFFRGVRATRGGGGVTYHRRWSRWETSVLALKANTLTAAGDASYRRPNLAIGGGGGLFQGRELAHARANYRVERHLAVSANFLRTGPVNYGTVMAAAGVGPLSVFSSKLFGSYGGATYGGNLHVGVLDAGTSYLALPHNNSLGFSLSERIGQRLRVTEYANRGGGRWNVSLGGGYVASRFSIDVSQSTFFTPSASAPLRRALLATLHVQLPWRSLALNIGSGVTPDGKIRYGVDGDAFVGESLGSSRSANVGTSPRMSRYVISGQVVDEAGIGVAGAAIRVDKTLVWTDDNGVFQLRVGRNRPEPIAVDTSEFTAPGLWSCVSCPTNAVPDIPARIVIRKQ